jgi:hypothetical protein
MIMRLRIEERFFVWQLPSKSTVYKLYVWDVLHRRSNYCQIHSPRPLLRRHEVALLVEILYDKPDGRGFDSWWCRVELT